MNCNTSSNRPAAGDVLVSVVLPVYNEAEVLPELLRRVRDALAACATDYEIIFVDDGSQDHSPRVLDKMAAADSHVLVVHLSRNFGHQAAVQAGLAHSRGDAVVLMDSDLQDTPEAIGRFLAQWRAGYDVVYAIRTQRKENLAKRLLFAGFHWLMSHVASVPIPADAGIFGLVDRRVADQIIALAENDRYFPGLRGWVGFRQAGVVVERGARYDDHPRVSLRGLIRLAKTAMFSFSTLPLTIFHAIGATAMVLFLGLSGYSLFCKLFTSLAIPGWTSYVLIGTFFGALNALGISILGEYMIRIYDQVRGRPLYIVDHTANNMDACGETAAEDDLAGDRPYSELMEEAEALMQAAAVRNDQSAADAGSEELQSPVLLPIRNED
jgi:dolichol-phosphate mannosyltransferase